MKELFLLVRPPRPVWPFNGSSTAFWPPLAFASLAGALLHRFDDLDVEILDAPALEMGWRSLAAEMQRRRPAYVGIGEEAVSAKEGLRLAEISRQMGAVVIAGGCFFGHVAPEALRSGLIDVVVHGEGEVTLVELVEALRVRNTQALKGVKGISFLDEDGQVVSTPRRPLIADLDGLPMPAYHLLPVHRYGRDSRNHPDFAAMELGRGCIGSCDFCVLWRQMGRTVGGRTRSHLRVKSPERLFDEVQRLRRDFHRRYIGWVDPCFNADPDVPARLADLLLRQGIRIGQSAWVRADCIIRDARSGALDRLVDAGLNEVFIGVERQDDAGLRALKKTTTVERTTKAFEVLAHDHPSVFRVGTFIYGLPGDTGESMRAMYRFSVELGTDMSLFIPLTPLPGTPLWNADFWDGTGERFRDVDFLPRLGSRGAHSLEQSLVRAFMFDWSLTRVQGYLRGFLSTDSRRRRLTRRLAWRGARLWTSAVVHRVSSRVSPGGMILPAWYDS